TPGTLYAATMLPEMGSQSHGVGTATLRLSPDETQATLRFSYTNLTSALIGEHIHSEQYLAHPSQIVFDIDTASPQPDGSYVWAIGASGGLSAADIVE